MKILPFVHRGEVFCRNDNTVELVAMQAIATANGLTVLRIGKNTYWFNADGTYDGPEMSVDMKESPHTLDHLKQLLAESEENKGHAPADAYFEPGTVGWDREIAGWPASERPAKPTKPVEEPKMTVERLDDIILKPKS